MYMIYLFIGHIITNIMHKSIREIKYWQCITSEICQKVISDSFWHPITRNTFATVRNPTLLRTEREGYREQDIYYITFKLIDLIGKLLLWAFLLRLMLPFVSELFLGYVVAGCVW